MRALILVCAVTHGSASSAEEVGVGPLLPIRLEAVGSLLPPDTLLLHESASIEGFLEALDGRPPDWPVVYGHGHHDPSQGERLFELNRERDAKRAGKVALSRSVAFLWDGELSAFDAEAGGFRVALGPLFTQTRWGMVRFKYEDLPSTLIAVPSPEQRSHLLALLQQGSRVTIDVVMAGVLVPDESIVYDFSHDQDGMGLVMPVVRVERLLYLYPHIR